MISRPLPLNSRRHIALTVHVPQNEDLEKLRPFFLWYTDAIKNTYTHSEKAFAAIGYGIGFMSTYSGYPLGTNFVELLFGNNSLATQILRVPVGLISFIPTGVLLANPSRDEFRDYARFLTRRPNLPVAPEATTFRKVLKTTATVSAYILAPFTGVPFYILMQPYFTNIAFLNVFAPLTAIISSYCGTIRVERMLIENYFSRSAHESEHIKTIRKNLDLRIDAMQKVLNRKSANTLINLQYDEAIRTLYQEILALTDNADAAAKASLVLQKLLLNPDFTQKMNLIHLADTAQQINPHDDTTTSERDWKKICVDIAVTLTAAISTYIFYSLAIETAQLGFSSDYAFCVFIAVLSVASNAMFDVMYAKFDTDKIYQAYADGQRIPSRQAVWAHIIACGSSIPNTYVAIRQALDASDTAQLVLIPATTFVGASLARAEAFNELIDSCVQTIKKNNPGVIRANLNSYLEKVRRAVWVMPAELVTSLSNILETASASHAFLGNLSDSPHSLFARTPNSAPIKASPFELAEASQLVRSYSC